MVHTLILVFCGLAAFLAGVGWGMALAFWAGQKRNAMDIHEFNDALDNIIQDVKRRWLDAGRRAFSVDQEEDLRDLLDEFFSDVVEDEEEHGG